MDGYYRGSIDDSYKQLLYQDPPTLGVPCLDAERPVVWGTPTGGSRYTEGELWSLFERFSDLLVSTVDLSQRRADTDTRNVSSGTTPDTRRDEAQRPQRRLRRASRHYDVCTSAG